MSEKRTAVVTGASRGIGRAIALELGGRGAQIVGTATSASGAAAISEYLAAAGLAGRGAVLDVAKPDSVDAFFKELDAAEGERGLRRRQFDPHLLFAIRQQLRELEHGLARHDDFLARQLRADPQLARMRIVAVTGSGREDDRQGALDAGCDQYMLKPLDLDFVRSLLG